MPQIQNSRLAISIRLGAALLALSIFAIGWIAQSNVIDDIYQQYSDYRSALSEKIQYEIESSTNLNAELAVTLSNDRTIVDYVVQPPNSELSGSLKAQISQTFLAVANARPLIQQIRFIDADGMERLRVDSDQGNARIIDDSELQFKGDRYYFTESMASTERSWVSPLDLNIENGKVEIPYRPTIRASAKVVVDGAVKGIVIVNVDKGELVKFIDNTLAVSSSWMINSDGYFISSPDHRNWGWILNKPGHNASATFNSAWLNLQSLQGSAPAFINGDEYLGIRISPQLYLHSEGSGDHYYILTKTPDDVLSAVLNTRIISLLLMIALSLIVLATTRVIERLIVQLEEEHRLATEHSQAKADFLARMSHEIRTPINGISGFIQLLQREQQTPQSRIYLEEAQGSLDVLSTIINDILDMSKIEAGKLKLEHRPFNLDKTVQTVGKVIGQIARGKSLNLMFDFDPNRPRNLIGDPVRLQQILLNLCSNAVKFTDHGDISVRLDVLAREKGRVQLGIDVCDTGIGMSMETVEQLFKPFEQGDHNDVVKHGGTGLGLVITDQLVKMMQGRVGIQSKVGEGTTVSFNIWVDVNEQLETDYQHSSSDTSFNALILTSNINTAAVIRRQCAVLGWPSVVLKDRQDIETFEPKGEISTIGQTVALVDEYFLSNVIDSKSLKDWLLQKPEIKSILLVSHNFDGYGHEKLEYHDGFIVKPFVPSTLLDAVMELTAESVDEDEIVSTSHEDIGNNMPLKGVRILLAEDNRVNQLVGIKLLEGQGAKVTLACDGQEALQALKNPSNTFDVILMDMQMPNLDGIGATKQIRSDKRFDSLPIIALTANAMPEDRILCLEAGMQDHTAKPFTAEAISELITKHVKTL